MGGAARHTSCRCFCPAREEEANKREKWRERAEGQSEMRGGENTQERPSCDKQKCVCVCGGQVKRDTDGIRAGGAVHRQPRGQ